MPQTRTLTLPQAVSARHKLTIDALPPHDLGKTDFTGRDTYPALAGKAGGRNERYLDFDLQGRTPKRGVVMGSRVGKCHFKNVRFGSRPAAG